MSTGQVETRNSERRRRALVSSCACIRLESAISTAIAVEPAAGDGLMRQASDEIQQRSHGRGARRSTQGNMSHNSREVFNSGKENAVLWKIEAKCTTGADTEWTPRTCRTEASCVSGGRLTGSLTGALSRGDTFCFWEGSRQKKAAICCSKRMRSWTQR